MPLILSIDVSTEPVRLVVARVSGKRLELVESRTVEASPLFSSRTLLASKPPLERPPPSEIVPVSPDAGSTAVETVLQYSQAGEITDAELAHEALLRLKAAIAGIHSEWNAASLIVPGHEYFSLNLDLPFGDQKTLTRVLDLEVQDLVPFDISEYLLEHRSFGTRSTGAGASGFDVHVSALPKRVMRNLLDIFRFCEVQPAVVTTPSSALSACFYLAADYFPENAAIVHEGDSYVAVCIRVQDEVRKDRMLKKSDPLDEAGYQALVTELKLTLAATERYYGVRFEQVFLSGPTLIPAGLQQGLAREIEVLDMNELCVAPEREDSFAALAATFVCDPDPAPVLTNFRTREFSFGPQLKNLIEVFVGMRWHIAGAIGCIAISLAFLYGVRSYRIRALRSRVQEHIASVVPNFTAEPGQEVAALDRINQQMSTDLETLGSPSKFTPLDSLLQLSKDIPLDGGVVIRQLQIKGSKITIGASANTYGPGDKMEQALRQKKDTYCRVKRDQGSLGGGAAGGVNFGFEVILCD